MMRLYLIILLFPLQGFCQLVPFKLIDTDVYNTDTITEKVLGQFHSFTRLTLNVKTRVKDFCFLGKLHRNSLHLIGDAISLSYVYDSSGALRKAMLKEIQSYAKEMEDMAKQYKRGPDYTYQTYNKSFRYNNKQAIPVIYNWVGSEEAGNYMLYLVDNYFYKITLIDPWGEGSLSGFEQSNIRFIENEVELDPGAYVKNVQTVKQIMKTYK